MRNVPSQRSRCERFRACDHERHAMHSTERRVPNHTDHCTQTDHVTTTARNNHASCDAEEPEAFTIDTNSCLPCGDSLAGYLSVYDSLSPCLHLAAQAQINRGWQGDHCLSKFCSRDHDRTAGNPWLPVRLPSGWHPHAAGFVCSIFGGLRGGVTPSRERIRPDLQGRSTERDSLLRQGVRKMRRGGVRWPARRC